MTDRSLPAEIIKLSPHQTQNAWVDAAFEIMRWHLDNFERFFVACARRSRGRRKPRASPTRVRAHHGSSGSWNQQPE
jgi:hypothetical protein